MYAKRFEKEDNTPNMQKQGKTYMCSQDSAATEKRGKRKPKPNEETKEDQTLETGKERRKEKPQPHVPTTRHPQTKKRTPSSCYNRKASSKARHAQLA